MAEYNAEAIRREHPIDGTALGARRTSHKSALRDPPHEPTSTT
jgi:hypothetical protein